MSVSPLSDEDRKALRIAVAGRYLSGQCYAMAVALHRRTGWPLVAARATDGTLPHAGVRRPDGRVMDVRGAMDETTFLRDYWAAAVVPVDEAQLAAADPTHMEERIAAADRLLDDLFPDLPPSGRDTRVTAFLADLHALCVRHGLYVRAPVPGAPPVLYEAYGDEAGFTATRLALGGWTFDRQDPAADALTPSI